MSILKQKSFNNLISVLSVISLVTAFVVGPLGSAYAQDGDGGIDSLVDDTKTDLLIVVGGGLAGAILGLSTLSFVEEPKEHTRNIIVGASLGIIAGVAVVAFSQATKSKELIYAEGVEAEEASIYFNTRDRRGWHASNDNSSPIITPYNIGVSFRY